MSYYTLPIFGIVMCFSDSFNIFINYDKSYKKITNPLFIKFEYINVFLTKSPHESSSYVID